MLGYKYDFFILQNSMITGFIKFTFSFEKSMYLASGNNGEFPAANERKQQHYQLLKDLAGPQVCSCN
jgi:hypothetical protein